MSPISSVNNALRFAVVARAKPATAVDPANAAAAGAVPAAKTELTPAQQQQVAELKARDQEVRQHEQAHLAAAGKLAVSGPTYTYQRGPDGVNYAIGGEVQIALREGRTPEETLENAEQARAAALAPAEPSAQDRAVAAEAAQLIAKAQAELNQKAQANSGNQAVTATEAASRGSEIGPDSSLQNPDVEDQRLARQQAALAAVYSSNEAEPSQLSIRV
jgi:hypothetical protein